MNLHSIAPTGAARINGVPDSDRAGRLRAQAHTDRAASPFAHCLKHAVQAFHDQQARLDAHSIAVNQAQRDEQTVLEARAEAANDLGTIQGLLPLQPYRFAVGPPPLLPQRTFGR
ncbi:hypothetical protein [Achromobacter marplatensis]|uniref:hypothetical protein n=1 Tax=Achromobacter marplatensis TaxID=470868 RepID=UPI0039F6CBD6